MGWPEEFQHESITDDTRPAFVTAMSKYDSQEAAIIGGFNAQKITGKPFKMPESMENLPDHASRNDFTMQAHKLLGIEHAKDIEALSGLDLKVGAAEGAQMDDDLAASFKQFCVDEKIQTSHVQKLVGFYNGAMAKAGEAIVQKQEADKLAAAEETNKALIEFFGGEEKVKEQSELMRRAIQNNFGLSADEYEQVGDAMADSIMTKNPVMARVLLKALAPYAAEGKTDGGTGTGVAAGSKEKPYEYLKRRFPKSETMWGKPDDRWEDQSIQLRKQAGIK